MLSGKNHIKVISLIVQFSEKLDSQKRDRYLRDTWRHEDVLLLASVAMNDPGHPVYGSTRLQFGELPGRRLDDVLWNHGGKAGFSRARPQNVT